jgi:uncharacterized protein YndB with AHSA1/START domain
MKATRHGSATVEFPSDREVLVTRQFNAPAELVFDVLTKPEHVSGWFAAKPLDCQVCEIDLRVGGEYHFEGFIMDDDVTTCSFRGTYLEIKRPVRTVETWVFEGRPDDSAVETVELHEEDGVTTMTPSLPSRTRRLATRGLGPLRRVCMRQMASRGATTGSRSCSPHSRSRGHPRARRH